MSKTIINFLLPDVIVPLKKKIVIDEDDDILVTFGKKHIAQLPKALWHRDNNVGKGKWQLYIDKVSLIYFYSSAILGNSYNLPIHTLHLNKKEKSKATLYLHDFNKKVEIVQEIIRTKNKLFSNVADSIHFSSDSIEGTISHQFIPPNDTLHTFFIETNLSAAEVDSTSTEEECSVYVYSVLSNNNYYETYYVPKIEKNLNKLRKLIKKQQKLVLVNKFLIGE